MKKIISALLFATLVLASGCSNYCQNDEIVSKGEKEYIKFSLNFMKIESLEGILGFYDYFVLCKVNSRGKSYLRSGEFDPSETDKSITEQLMSIQTPYEIEVLEIYKCIQDDFEVGNTITAVAAHGEIANYIVDFGLPQLEIGEIYLLPLDHPYSNDEFGIVTSYSVKVSQTSELSTDSSKAAELEPLMHTEPYKNFQTLQDFEIKVAEIMNSSD